MGTDQSIFEDFGTILIIGPIGTTHVQDQGRLKRRTSSCNNNCCWISSFVAYHIITQTWHVVTNETKPEKRPKKQTKGNPKLLVSKTEIKGFLWNNESKEMQILCDKSRRRKQQTLLLRLQEENNKWKPGSKLQ